MVRGASQLTFDLGMDPGLGNYLMLLVTGGESVVPQLGNADMMQSRKKKRLSIRRGCDRHTTRDREGGTPTLEG